MTSRCSPRALLPIGLAALFLACGSFGSSGDDDPPSTPTPEAGALVDSGDLADVRPASLTDGGSETAPPDGGTVTTFCDRHKGAAFCADFDGESHEAAWWTDSKPPAPSAATLDTSGPGLEGFGLRAKYEPKGGPLADVNAMLARSFQIKSGKLTIQLDLKTPQTSDRVIVAGAVTFSTTNAQAFAFGQKTNIALAALGKGEGQLDTKALAFKTEWIHMTMAVDLDAPNVTLSVSARTENGAETSSFMASFFYNEVPGNTVKVEVGLFSPNVDVTTEALIDNVLVTVE